MEDIYIIDIHVCTVYFRKCNGSLLFTEKFHFNIFFIFTNCCSFYFVDNTVHYFLLLIRNHAQVIVTQMLSTHDPMMRGSLDFPNLIKIHGICGNFKLNLEIYSMVSRRKNCQILIYKCVYKLFPHNMKLWIFPFHFSQYQEKQSRTRKERLPKSFPKDILHQVFRNICSFKFLLISFFSSVVRG